MQKAQEEKSLRYYRSIDFLPIGCFNKASETGDLRYLLKLKDYEELPEYNTEGLQEVWEDIREEYIEHSVMQNKKAESILELEHSIFVLKARYSYLNTLIYLTSIDVEGREKHLKELKSKGIIIEYKDEEDFKKKLELESKKTGTIITKIKTKQKELERLTKKDKSVVFEDMLDILEQYKGYNINIWKLSVKRWLSLLKNFEKHNKRIKDGTRTSKQR